MNTPDGLTTKERHDSITLIPLPLHIAIVQETTENIGAYSAILGIVVPEEGRVPSAEHFAELKALQGKKSWVRFCVVTLRVDVNCGTPDSDQRTGCLY